MKKLPIISFKKYNRNKFIIWGSAGVAILTYIALFGGIRASAGNSLLTKFEAPDWAYIGAGMLLISSLILLIKMLFDSESVVGYLTVNRNTIDVKIKETQIFPLKDLTDLKVSANWSAPRTDQDMHNWTIDFKYQDKSYHYDFLLQPELKDTLLKALIDIKRDDLK